MILSTDPRGGIGCDCGCRDRFRIEGSDVWSFATTCCGRDELVISRPQIVLENSAFTFRLFDVALSAVGDA